MDDSVAAGLRAVVMRLYRGLNQSATHAGLTPSQASILAIVATRGMLTLSEVTAIEGLNPTMSSRIIGILEERGLVQRRPHPEDHRVVIVEATDAGSVLKDSIRKQRDRVVSEALSRLDAGARSAIIAALPALHELVGELDTHPPR